MTEQQLALASIVCEWALVCVTGTAGNGVRYVGMVGVVGCRPKSDGWFKVWPKVDDDSHDGKVWFDVRTVESVAVLEREVTP